MEKTTKMIYQLLKTYSSLLQIPIYLLDEWGNLCNCDDHKDEVYTELSKECFKISKSIQKPIIMNPNNEDKTVILCPVFIFNNQDYLLVTDYFSSVTETSAVDFKNGMKSFTREQQVSILHELEQLMVMIGFMIENTRKVDIQKNYLTMINSFSENTRTEEKKIKELLGQVKLTTRNLDFIGYAVETQNNLFEIQDGVGFENSQLMGSSFYLGEGLLGQSVALEQNIEHCNVSDTHRGRFFAERELNPNQVFAFPIKSNNKVNALLFGGTLTSNLIPKEFIDSLQLFSNYLGSVLSLKEASKEVEENKLVKHLLLELLEIYTHTSTPSHVMFKILDFCSSINQGDDVRIKLVNGESFKRGSSLSDLDRLHEHAFQTHFSTKSVSAECDVELIGDSLIYHIPMITKKTFSGLLSFKVKQDYNLAEMEQVLRIVCDLGGMSYNIVEKSEDTEAKSSKTSITMLYQQLEYWNKELFNLTNNAVELAKSFSMYINESVNLSLVQQACQVSTYQLSFLQKQGIELDVLSCLEEVFAPKNTMNQAPSKEAQILGLIANHLKMTGSVCQLTFEQSLTKQFNMFLEKFNYLEDVNLTKANELDIRKIEELEDLTKEIDLLPLTAREKEILFFILEGLNNQEVADQLNISSHTVKNHLTNIFRKLDVTDRVQAMAKIYRIKYGI
ncbi:response regulator transcription factor [Halalkalibacter akibai]|nr:helix-turn-helix transcriptional regulator [Halalkalibacter akibai]